MTSTVTTPRDAGPRPLPHDGVPIRIGMVLDQPFPPDARVYREATALAEAGFKVHLLCEFKAQDKNTQWQKSQEGKKDEESEESKKGEEPEMGEASEEIIDGIQVHRVDPAAVTDRVLGVKTKVRYKGLFRNMLRAFLHIDTRWKRLIADFVETHHIDVLHVHDLRQAPTGLSVSEVRGIPLVLDLHENYPALMALVKGKGDEAKAIKAKKKWEKIESYATWEADHVITVVEEASQRLVEKGVPAHKVTVVPNVVDVGTFESVEADSSVLNRFSGDFLLAYVGFVNGPHRGIHTVLEALAELKTEIPNLKFVAAGGHRPAYKARLDALIEQYELQEHVVFTGWLDEKDFVSYIQAADICVCPHAKNPHTQTAFPNKVYLYNLMAKPVIVSDCAPLVRYINDSGGGTTFASEDPADLARAIRALYQNSKEARQLGRTGRQAVLKTYSWTHAKTRLVQVYQNLLAEHPAYVIPTGL